MSIISDIVSGSTTVTPRVQAAASAATATGSASAPTAPTSAAAAGTAAATQAQAGAAQTQPSAQAAGQVVAEVFNAPMLDLPADPTTSDVLQGLARAMADPRVNKSSVDALGQLRGMLFAAQKEMASIYLERQP